MRREEKGERRRENECGSRKWRAEQRIGKREEGGGSRREQEGAGAGNREQGEIFKLSFKRGMVTSGIIVACFVLVCQLSTSL